MFEGCFQIVLSELYRSQFSNQCAVNGFSVCWDNGPPAPPGQTQDNQDPGPKDAGQEQPETFNPVGIKCYFLCVSWSKKAGKSWRNTDSRLLNVWNDKQYKAPSLYSVQKKLHNAHKSIRQLQLYL